MNVGWNTHKFTIVWKQLWAERPFSPHRTGAIYKWKFKCWPNIWLWVQIGIIDLHERNKLKHYNVNFYKAQIWKCCWHLLIKITISIKERESVRKHQTAIRWTQIIDFVPTEQQKQAISKSFLLHILHFCGMHFGMSNLLHVMKRSWLPYLLCTSVMKRNGTEYNIQPRYQCALCFRNHKFLY